MQNAFKTLALILCAFACLILAAGAAQPVKINDLVEQAAEYNGKTVTIEGEAIGEAMERGEYTWVNINDGSNAIGLWMRAADAQKITTFGDYKHVGDTVTVTGTFSRDCAEHGGDVDIHVASLTVTAAGHDVKETLSQNKILAAAILSCVTLIIAFLYWKFVKKQKQS